MLIASHQHPNLDRAENPYTRQENPHSFVELPTSFKLCRHYYA